MIAVLLADALLEPLLAPHGRHAPVTMKLGRPRKNLQDEAPGEGRRRRLTGSFVEPDYADPLDKKPPRSGMGAARWWVRPAQPNADDPSDERDAEPMPDFRQPEPWSSRSVLARSRWKDPEYKERVLAKRRATRAANGNTPVATARPEPATPGAAQRAEALRLLSSDEEEWMRRRLAAGEGAGRARADPAERARKRSEQAKQRYAKRRQNLADGSASAEAAGAAGAASEPTGSGAADAEPPSPRRRGRPKGS